METTNQPGSKNSVASALNAFAGQLTPEAILLIVGGALVLIAFVIAALWAYVMWTKRWKYVHSMMALGLAVLGTFGFDAILEPFGLTIRMGPGWLALVVACILCLGLLVLEYVYLRFETGKRLFADFQAVAREFYDAGNWDPIAIGKKYSIDEDRVQYLIFCLLDLEKKYPALPATPNS